jgi:hypothetical protein
MLEVSQSFKDTVYAPIRQFNARITFTLLGTTNIYNDETIIRMNILEEMSTLNDTIPSNELQLTLDNSEGAFNVLSYQNMQQIIASRPKVVVEFGLVVTDTVTEWIPMGMYYLSEWKHEVGTKTITLTCNDVFNMLDAISYENTASNTLYNLAVDILTKAGITSYSIDDSLKQTTSNFPNRLNSREALQHIGIASGSAVFQDRSGKVVIKPFTTLDASSNYLTYAGQSGLYASASSYPLVTTGAGMKYIDFDNMYDIPEITLDKSIYQVVINVRDGSTTHEKVYTNTSIAGTNGSSFTIDNPLIINDAMADKVAAWYIRESNYNAIYKANWRQNPILECTDVVLVEDSFEAKKQTRIYRQEFNYEGYLMGITESRGGI